MPLPAEVSSKPQERTQSTSSQIMRRLVAIGHAVDDVLGPGARGQKRAAQHVGLDIDHDDVLAAVDGRERMPHAGDRVAGRLDDALDLVAGGERGDVVEDAGLAGLDRVAEARGAVALGRPADPGERCARLADVEIGDTHDVAARDALRLRQHHRAELAGADQADPNGTASRRPLPKQG